MDRVSQAGGAADWCPFQGVRVDSARYPFGEGVFFRAVDGAGRVWRLIAMPPGRVPPLDDRVVAEQADKPALVRPVAFASTAAADYWLTEWPGSSDFLGVFARADVDAESKRLLAARACEAVMQARRAGAVAGGAVNPAALFVDSQGGVKFDGVGYGEVVAGYQAQRLAACARDLKEYLPRPSAEVEEEPVGPEVRGLGMVLFELYAGGLPRGSFFRMPSEVTGFDTRLDDALMTAVGQGSKGARIDVGGIARTVESVGYGGTSDEAPVFVPAGDPDQDLLDLTGRKRGSRVDGLFSWLPNWMFLVAIIAGAIAAAAISFVNKEREKLAELAINIDPAMRMLDEAEELFNLRKRVAALQKIAVVSQGAPISEEVIARMAAIMVKENEYGEFGEHGGGYVERARTGGGPGSEAMIAVFEEFEGKYGDYTRAIRIASKMAEYRHGIGEMAALGAAREIFPDDREAARRVAGHPFELERVAVAALRRVREDHPLDMAMRWKVVSGVGGLRIDLSGNPELSDIGGLEGQPVRDLDLSDTAVRELWALEAMPLRRLKMDRTDVRTLAPVVSAPLTDLSFARAAIAAAPFLDGHPTLLRYRGHVSGKLKRRHLEPAPGVDWENTLGMGLVALDEAGLWLGEHEVRVADYRSFVSRAGYRGGGDLPVRGRGWQMSRAALAAEQMPVTGVSRRDAEAFCRWLTTVERERGLLDRWQRYRLPNDLEWSSAAGLRCVPYQDLRSRSRQRLGQRRANRTRFDLIEFRGWREPAGAYPLEDLGEENREAISRLAPVGSFHSYRRVADLATGVREWLADDWERGGDLASVRGSGWRNWAGADASQAGGDPLLLRSGIAASTRSDDIGFRVVLEDMSMTAVPPLATLAAGGKWGS